MPIINDYIDDRLIPLNRILELREEQIIALDQYIKELISDAIYEHSFFTYKHQEY